jgi:hypothetical protein
MSGFDLSNQQGMGMGGRNGSESARDITEEKVLLGFSADDEACLATGYSNDGRAGGVVVVAPQNPAVRTRGGHCDQVSWLEVRGKIDVFDDNVPALTVLADDPGQG